MQRRVEDEPMTKGRTMRLTDVGGVAPKAKQARFAPSVERSRQERERRHRERAIASWLRDLSR